MRAGSVPDAPCSCARARVQWLRMLSLIWLVWRCLRKHIAIGKSQQNVLGQVGN